MPSVIRDSPTNWSAREQLKHKKKHAAEKLLLQVFLMTFFFLST